MFPPQLTGTANGVNNFFVMFGGGVYQIFLGLIIGHYVSGTGQFTPESFKMAFMFLFASMLIGTIAIFFTRETMAKQPAKTA